MIDTGGETVAQEPKRGTASPGASIPFHDRDLRLAVRHPETWFADNDDGVLYLGSDEEILENPLGARLGVGMKIQAYPAPEVEGMRGAPYPLDTSDPERLLEPLSDWLLAPLQGDSIETLDGVRRFTRDGHEGARMVRRLRMVGAAIRVLHAVLLRGEEVLVIQGITPDFLAARHLPTLEAVFDSLTLEG